MRQIIATLLTLCLVSVVLPPTSTTPADEGISTCEYIISDYEN
ncbi:hypothetical protein IMSAGC011_02174 [Lachnospiraceae bacterium]|nr:hypothetical protein IMSAGC011_02174 [Lachnospiraceae bacterium]